MNTSSSAMPEFAQPRQTSPRTLSPTRPLFWAIRRELWENPSIYVAPIAVAAVALVAFTLSAFAGVWESPLRLDPSRPQGPYDIVGGLMMLTAIVVSVFYCIDALHGERRDRSILLWKSLPVSDSTTVLAKASIPILILPVIASAITVATYWMMLLVSSAILLIKGQSVATLWGNLSVLRMSLLLLYHLLTAHGIWPAPVYCWLLLVSGWARRATFLWAVLPVIAIAGFERIAFGTWRFASLIASRFIGDAPVAASTSPQMLPTNPMIHITPGLLLTSPGLWIGLALSAAFLFAAIRLRRYQGPI
jgi:ABC-2 type transport system permease protein